MTRLTKLSSSRYVNVLLLLALGALWGSSYLFIKIVVAEIPAFTLVFGRLTAAAIVMWIILYAIGRSMPTGVRIWRSYAMLGLFGAALPYSLITWGEQYISSGLASLLQSTTPIFTVLIAQIATHDERLTVAKIAGVLIGFLGVGLLILPDLRQGLRASLLGQLAIVGSSVCYAWTAIYSRFRLRGQQPIATATGQLTMGALLMLPLSLLIDRPFDLAPSARALLSWSGLTLLGTIMAYVIYYTIIERTSATFATMVTYVIPVNGLLLGALILGEPLRQVVFVSLGLILTGVLLVRDKG